ncbi:MAG: tetratricopeptide repeat protein [Gammaproteobacteria bacterium]
MGAYESLGPAWNVIGPGCPRALCILPRGLRPDGRKAETWLSRAAEAGQVSAQSILGMMYATGAGVPKNPQKAQKWLYAAAGKGDEHAIQMLDLLARDAGALRL